MAEVNGKHPHIERNRNGTFVRGHAGFGGRKPGSRGKLSEAFLADLFSEWKRSGRAALAQVAKEDPAIFLKIISTVVPRILDVDATLNVRSELAIEISNFAQAYELWGRHVGAAPPLIEATPEEDVGQEDD